MRTVLDKKLIINTSKDYIGKSNIILKKRISIKHKNRNKYTQQKKRGMETFEEKRRFEQQFYSEKENVIMLEQCVEKYFLMRIDWIQILLDGEGTKDKPFIIEKHDINTTGDVYVGDYIEFTNRVTEEKVLVEVINLHKYNSFEELYKHFDKVSMGYSIDEDADPKDMEQYYSQEEQSKYGVVGIELEIIL